MELMSPQSLEADSRKRTVSIIEPVKVRRISNGGSSFPSEVINIETVEEDKAKNSWKRLQLARSKLKTSIRNSALLAGFAMVPMVELQINDDEDDPVPLPILIGFAVVTISLISVHLLALMIASCILPYIDTIALSETEASDDESINDSPHDKMHLFIEASWMFSNIFGILLFLLEIIFTSWVKFWQIGKGEEEEPGKQVAAVSTGVLLLSVVFFIWFSVHFYRSLAEHEYERSNVRIEHLESQFQRKRKFSVWAKSQFGRKKSIAKWTVPSYGSSSGHTNQGFQEEVV